MPLTPGLKNVEALFRKAGREFTRAVEASGPTSMADHFYNFCVTVNSFEDFLLERLAKTTPVERRPIVSKWRRFPLVGAVNDIANSAKHFQLRHVKSGQPRPASIRRVRHSRSGESYALFTDDGGIDIRLRRAPSMVVVLKDGATYDIYAFMQDVLTFWKNELAQHGIRVYPPQGLAAKWRQ